MRSVLSLPIRNGGLAINQPDDYSRTFSDSQTLSAPLNDPSADLVIVKKNRMKTDFHKGYMKTAMQKSNHGPRELRPTIHIEAREEERLNALPIGKHGLWLTKSEFRDALCFRYGWDFQKVPSACACGSPYFLSLALHCLKGRYPVITQNKIRDLFNQVLKKVGHDVGIEPHLQRFDNETFTNSTCTEDEACLDIPA